MALIAVVDDEFLLADLLASLLVGEGHEVMTAPHGRAALLIVRERKPALIITDFMMPLMTGLELAQALQADSELSDIPLILVSGAQGSTAREHHNNLFAAIFDKPYDAKAMLETVQEILDRPIK